jgi:excisionase family DNA binding protein
VERSTLGYITSNASVPGVHVESRMTDRDQAPPTIAEAARALNASEHIVRRALKRGELRGFRIGREWRIDPQSLDDLRTGRSSPEAA